MEAIINTVSTIFKERYGAILKIETEFTETKRKPRFSSQWQSHFVYSRTLRQVSFLIFNSRRELQAVATAGPVENKDAVMFDEMAQFLQLTIAEHIELTDRRDIQERTEEAMELAHANHTNVVELKTRKISETPASFQYKEVKQTKPADTTPIWISGTNEDFNAHIAFSIHDWVANWAFINAKEIPDLVWQDPHAWQNFPQVTLFVPDIATLSKTKLEILKSNLEQLSKIKGPKPLIVISSPTEISDELKELQHFFKCYEANDKVTARVQAHFLLFHHKKASKWTHQCKETDSIYFLPFSPSPTNLH